ncbi:exostosin family protein [Striga asiatica]|uniref:Exostosin family protein n=1 Tax=Striga asiatica TaxID=4170 RepID=A0A5A7QY85_STRAF|nr:exostosin family protein [Striga asiatica]
MSEKSIFPSKLLSCLIAFSILLLVSSTLSLLEFNNTSLIPESVLQFITMTNNNNNKNNNNNFSINIKPNPETNKQQSPAISPLTKTLEKQDITVQDLVPPEKTSDEPEKYNIRRKCDKSRALLRVYMYDLPPQFHFGLLGWNSTASQTWPNVADRKAIPSYPGGLNLQHSIEYWLTLDLLASSNENITRPCTAVRVTNPNEADVIFVPFFSSLSYNRNSKRHHDGQKFGGDRVLQEKLVDFLKNRKEWRKSGGKDHVIMAHHPNSMLFVRRKLGSCMFVLSDFGRYSSKVANLEKDVIAPYKHMVRKVPDGESACFDERPTLVFFQGAIYRKDGGAIRQELYYLLKDEKDVHFTFGTAQSKGVKNAGKGMASSKFCLNIAGDTPSSNRLFDAIAANCVPVIISDEIELPFEDVLDYSKFCVFVRSADALKKGYLLKLLRGVSREKWTEMWEKLKEVSGHFEYRFPSEANDAVDMIWQTIARKNTRMARLNAHRKNRYSRSWLFR